MTFKRIEEIEAWTRGMNLAEEVYRATSSHAFEKDWGLRDHIRRAAVSIPSNVAEGFERNSEAEFNRFVLIAKGSCGELRMQLLLAGRIGYLSVEGCTKLTQECVAISSMLAGLSRHLTARLKGSKR